MDFSVQFLSSISFSNWTFFQFLNELFVKRFLSRFLTGISFHFLFLSILFCIFPFYFILFILSFTILLTVYYRISSDIFFSLKKGFPLWIKKILDEFKGGTLMKCFIEAPETLPNILGVAHRNPYQFKNE